MAKERKEVKRAVKKGEEGWDEHKWIFEGWNYTMRFSDKEFNITYEATGKVITKGKFKE